MGSGLFFTNRRNGSSIIQEVSYIDFEEFSMMVGELCTLFFGLFPGFLRMLARQHQVDIIFFRIGDPYKPSFATVTGRGTTQIILD